jgi:hypothetical protein
MARTRLLKPGFFSNDQLAECDPLARLLFAGLWTLADRDGRLECRHAKIKAQVLPYDDCDVAALLEQLAARDFVQVYAVDGRTYVQVNGFAKHQNPHHKETSDGLPEPPKNTGETQSPGNTATSPGISETSPGNTGTSPALTLNPLPLTLNPSDTHTHRAREADSEFRKPGWAATEWAAFVAAWNSTQRAAKWDGLTPPDGWVDAAASPGWLQKARQAVQRLPRCQYFGNPLAVTQFIQPGWADRILAGEFDNAKAKHGRNGDERPPPVDQAKRRFYRADAGKQMTDAEHAAWIRDQRSGGVVSALATATRLKEEDL